MEYNETLARELQQRHDLSDATVNNWRRQRRIPDAYQDPGYSPKRDYATPDQEKLVFALLNLGAINNTRLAVDGQRLIDIRRRKGSRMRVEEFYALQEDFRELKEKINAYLDTGKEEALQEVLSDRRLKPFTLIPNRVLVQRIRRGGEVKPKEHEYLQEVLKAFMIAITI